MYSYFDWERLSEEVHVTIAKGIVGGFEFWMALETMDIIMFANAKGKQQK